MVLRKRKATKDDVEMLDKKSKAVSSNDVEEETEVQDELEEYEEEDPNYAPSDEECDDLDHLLDDVV